MTFIDDSGILSYNKLHHDHDGINVSFSMLPSRLNMPSQACKVGQHLQLCATFTNNRPFSDKFLVIVAASLGIQQNSDH